MIFSTESYRSYLKGRIKGQGLSYESFVAKNPGIMTFGTFKHFISGSKNLSVQTFLKLIKPFHLKQEEVFYLFLLSLENDLDPRIETNAPAISFYKKLREHVTPFLRGDYKEHGKGISPEAQVLIDSLGLLGKKSKTEILDVLRTELNKNITRQNNATLAKGLLLRLAKIN